MTQLDVRDIIGRIDTLTVKEKLHILNILKQHNYDYTKNSNGYFFNLANIPENVLLKMSKCLDLIEKNRDLIMEMDKRREEMLSFYKSVIEEKISMSISEKRNKYVTQIKIVKNPSNVSMEVRKAKPRCKKTQYDTNVDPDELIKEYMKSLSKISKDSVFGRLNVKLRVLKQKSGKRQDEIESYDYSNDGDTGGDVGGDVGGGGGDGDGDQIEGDLDDNTSVGTHDIQSEVSDIQSDIQSEHSYGDHEDIEMENDTEHYEEHQEDHKTKTEREMTYYRKILLQQGIACAENKAQEELVYQEYIA